MKRIAIFSVVLVGLVIAGKILAESRNFVRSPRRQNEHNTDSRASLPSASNLTDSSRHSNPETMRYIIRDKLQSIERDKLQSIEVYTELMNLLRQSNFETLKAISEDKSQSAWTRNEAMTLLRLSEYRSQLAEDLIQRLNDRGETEQLRSYFIQHLMCAAQDAEPESRERTRIVAAIAARVNDPSAEVRGTALMCLMRLNDPRALEKARLVFWSSEAPSVRSIAIHTLEHFNAKAYLRSIRWIAQNDANEAVRVAAIAALGGFKDERARDLLTNASQAPQFRIRRAAQVALNRLDSVREK
jgi:HEAT repeat protein